MTTADAANITARLVEYLGTLQPEKLPLQVLEVAKHSALDWLGAAIVGAQAPSVNIIVDIISSPNSRGTLIGRNTRASAFDAALANGSAGHASELDNVHDALGGHPSAAILPALFALSELHRTSGIKFLAAIVAGTEVQCKVAAIIGESLRQRGFHSTSIIGTLGAAAAAGYLLGLNGAEMANAIGIAACQSAGMRLAFGTMAKPLQVGSAAMNGFRAALLAQKGLSAPRNSLDPPLGFSGLYGLNNAAQGHSAPQRHPDRGFYILETMFKDYPCCFALHGPIDAALQMRALSGYNSYLIKEVDVVVSPGLSALCSLTGPTTAEETRFSLPYALALTLAEHDPTSVDAWSAEIAETPRMAALIKCIRPTVGPQSLKASCTLSILQSDRTRLSTASEFRIPSTDLLGQWRSLTMKFARNVIPILGEARTRLLITKFDYFLGLDDASIPLRLASLCHSNEGASQ